VRSVALTTLALSAHWFMVPPMCDKETRLREDALAQADIEIFDTRGPPWILKSFSSNNWTI
jgi:hypothetical protein